MASGIAVTDEVVSTFNAIKMGHKHKYAIFRINPECTEVVVEKVADQGTYEEFQASLPSNGCRYVIYDFDFTVSILHSALYFSEF
tara:strand:+ start:1145 stop:1399 length:255 start_codon:yes stop_codon:yes gene_type:complete